MKLPLPRIRTLLFSLFLSPVALMAQNNNTWDFGAGTQNWTDAANWGDPHGLGADHVPEAGGDHPGDEDANINTDTAGEYPIFTTGDPDTFRDIRVGNGAGESGRLDITGGAVATPGWFYIGQAGGSGHVVMQDTSSYSTGRTYVGDGAGSTGRLEFEDSSSASGTQPFLIGVGSGEGSIHINTTATVTTTGNIEIVNSGTVPSELNSGTFSAGNETWIGNGFGNTATLNITGGSLVSNRWIAVGRDSSTGILNVSGGTVTLNNDFLAVGSDLGDVDNPGSGTVNQSGGVVTVPQAYLGENGTSAGTYNMTGGTLNIGTAGGSGDFNIGFNADTAGVLTFDAGTINATQVYLGRNDSSNGTANLNGGTFNIAGIQTGAGTGNLNLNGTTINATANSTTFFNEGTVNLLAPLTTIDTSGFNVTGNAVFTGTGGITKLGSGTLTLGGTEHDFSGAINVQEGTLIAGGSFAAPISGDITVSDQATFGVFTSFPDDFIEPNSLTFSGPATALTVDFVDPNFAFPSAPIQVSGGNLALNGTITVNVAGTNFANGTYTPHRLLRRRKNRHRHLGRGQSATGHHRPGRDRGHRHTNPNHPLGTGTTLGRHRRWKLGHHHHELDRPGNLHLHSVRQWQSRHFQRCGTDLQCHRHGRCHSRRNGFRQ